MPVSTKPHADATPTPKTVMELVELRNFNYTDIVNHLKMNQRTVKHRLGSPWLFTAVELTRLASFLSLSGEALFNLVVAQAGQQGALASHPARRSRAGRPRLHRPGEAAPHAEEAASE